MNTLKECLYQTIHQNNKPLRVIAEELGVSGNYLTRSALPDADESDTGTGCRFPLKLLIPLIRATNNYSVLDAIEHSLGRFGVLLPPTGKAPTASYAHMMIKGISEFAEFMREVETAVADNKITERERERIQREGYQAAQAILTLVAACEGKQS